MWPTADPQGGGGGGGATFKPLLIEFNVKIATRSFYVNFWKSFSANSTKYVYEFSHISYAFKHMECILIRDAQFCELVIFIMAPGRGRLLGQACSGGYFTLRLRQICRAAAQSGVRDAVAATRGPYGAHGPRFM